MRNLRVFFDAGAWYSPFNEGAPVGAEGAEPKTFWALGILLALLPVGVAILKLLTVI